MLSDIKQAFLQIRLASETDKNRFCFLCVMETDWSLTVTKLSSSASMPFILNYVLKYHADKYAEDEFSKILKENLC